MKRLTLLFSLFLCWTLVSAQAPDSFTYQAIVRNSAGSPLNDQLVQFRISILEGSASGTVVYQETHSLTTNSYGLANFNIGTGSVLSGTMGAIDWNKADHFLQVEVDENGGTSYTLMGTSQLLSVPYAKHATTAAGFPKMTTAERDALPLEEGTVIYNTDEMKFQGVGGAQSSVETTDEIITSGGGSGYEVFSLYPQRGNSFTVTSNGSLTAVSFWVYAVSQYGTFKFNLYQGEGTSGQLLVSKDVAIALYGNKVNFDTPVDVKAGDKFTWTVQYISSGRIELAQSYSSYEGGTAYNNNFAQSHDFAFTTYIKPFTLGWTDLH